MKLNKITSIATALALTVFGTVGQAQTTCPQTTTKISLTADRLDKALAKLAIQTACPIKYDAKLTQRFRSPAVQGKLTPSAALIQLVKGTGLEVHMDTNLVINQADQEAIGLEATTLQASLGQAVKSQLLPQTKANAMFSQLSQVKTSVVDLARQQGFVSAAEKASYQRTFQEAQQLLASHEAR